MQKRIYFSLSVVLTLLISVGCSSYQTKAVPPDKALIEYLPTVNESYIGDSAYYHVVENIELESTPDSEIAILSGEVKDNATTITKDNFDFEIVLTVDAEKIVQTYSGSRLNESKFNTLILLKLPIEVGNTWTFTTQDDSGKKWKVTGEITSVDETGDELVVRHSIKDGYYEERVLKKGRGVTDFLRLLVYKNEKTYTGYHAEQSSISGEEIASSPNETNESNETMETAESLKIPVAYYNLILEFEQAWSGYVKGENEALLKFISEDSPAYEKIKAVPQDPDTAIAFVRFYPYEMSENGSVLSIKVVEIFKSETEEPIENKVLYQIVIEKGVAKIYDFENIE